MRAQQLAETATFRAFRHAFETATGLPLTLHEPGSFASPAQGSRHANPFCVALARNNQACAACLRTQGAVETRAAAGAATLECDAGLQESAIPVRVGDRVIAFLRTGQVALEKPNRKKIRALVAASEGLAEQEDDLESAYLQTRVISKEQYEAALRLLTIFAHHLATISYHTLVQDHFSEIPGIAKAKAFLANHLGEEIHLDDAARAANMSTFYFCKLFKKAVGQSFTSYVARRRVAVVQQQLLDSNVRISEVAYATGFQSLSQFNRVFRRLAGESPSAYRARLQFTAGVGAVSA